ncbi:hypothetical protein ABFS83_07G109500 [Erythranthe nasuta]
MFSGHLADFVHFTTIRGRCPRRVLGQGASNFAQGASNFGKREPVAPPYGRNGGPVVAGGRHHHPTAAAAVGRKKKKKIFFFFFFPSPFRKRPDKERCRIKKDARIKRLLVANKEVGLSVIKMFLPSQY